VQCSVATLYLLFSRFDLLASDKSIKSNSSPKKAVIIVAKLSGVKGKLVLDCIVEEFGSLKNYSTDIKFVSAEENDDEFQFFPYKAKVVIQKSLNSLEFLPFSDYTIAFYKKYDPESHDIAIRYNRHFPIDIVNKNNAICRRERA